MSPTPAAIIAELEKRLIGCPSKECPGGCLQTRPGTCAILKSEMRRSKDLGNKGEET
jgi:hypothetical protein